MITCINAVDPGHIGAQVGPQPVMGELVILIRRGSTTISLWPAEFDGPFDKAGDHRMVLGGVGAGDQDHIGVFDIGDGVRHCATSESCGQTGHGGAMSETGAMVDVVGFKHRPGEFLSNDSFPRW